MDSSCDTPRYCRPAFEPCDTHRDCCSFRCDRDEAGFKRCLPIGGCRTSGSVDTPEGLLNEFGEVCTRNEECCSGICEADPEGVLRCRKRGDPECDEPMPICL